MNHAKLCSIPRILRPSQQTPPPPRLPPLLSPSTAVTPPTSPSWTSLLLSFTSSLSHATAPDPREFPPLLKAASPSTGATLHQQAILFGYADDPYISSSLVCMYAKFGDISSARKVFDNMPVKNVVPWSAIIGAYSQLGYVDEAFEMWNEMSYEGIRPNSVTLLGLLSGISEMDHLRCLHGWVIRAGMETDVVLANSLVNVYSRCGSVELARQMFESMPLRDAVSWNSVLSSYSQHGKVRESVSLLHRMRSEWIDPDHQTFASLVSAAVNSHGWLYLFGKQVHAQIITSGFDLDMHVQTNLLSMYLKFRNVDFAFTIFHATKLKDAIIWTAMISGLVQNDRADEALAAFRTMLSSGVRLLSTTIATALSACAHIGLVNFGASVHGYIIRQQIPVDTTAENSLISMYAKCGHLNLCKRLFNSMQNKDVVSWNAIISAYAQNGDLEGALILFNRMRVSSTRPDSVTMIIVLQVCAFLGSLHYGKCSHGFLFRSYWTSSVAINTSLIDMYSKCGDLTSARICFDTVAERDLVSWSAIIEAYGSHGKGLLALRLFSEFLQTGKEPNQVMFLSVVAACSHSGLVLHGLDLFQSMKEEFGLDPKIEHYACIIDLLGRAGRVEEALEIIKAMPVAPNADVLGILLDACRIHKNSSIGKEVSKEIIALKPENAGSYVQLAHSFAATSNWDRVGETWRQMRSLRLRKAPAWSYVDFNGTINIFFAGHSSHTQYEKIILLLRTLNEEMRKAENCEFEHEFIHLYQDSS